MPVTAPSDQPMPADGPRVVPAATVVVFRRGRTGSAPEILMVQRAREMRFAGGATVFPGGRVDPADRVLARALQPDAPEEIAAARVAAVRETLEETGLALALERPVSAREAAEARAMLLERGELAPVLEAFAWRLQLDTLPFFAHWCPDWDGAFDTRFFLAHLGTGEVDVAVDATENTRLFWASAADALEQAGRGEISVIFPTRRNLERLALYRSYDDALADIAAHPVRRIHSREERREDGDWIVIPDDHGYPVVAERAETARRS